LYDSTTNKVNARESGAWVEFQPLDADLTAIAALTVTRGDILVGNATPAWSDLAIGASARYLRSNGTDPAWAQVTELGLVTSYNGITVVSTGLPSIVGQHNSTGNTANIGLTTLYAVPSDGFYRISAHVIITTVASVSSTLPQVNIVWTDGDNAVAQSTVLTGGIGVTPTPPPGYASAATQSATANTTTTLRAGDMVVFANSGTNINFSTSGYASVAAGMAYAVHIRVEAL